MREQSAHSKGASLSPIQIPFQTSFTFLPAIYRSLEAFPAENPEKVFKMGDRFLSSAGTGKNRALSVRLPNPSPVLDKNRAPMGPEILSSTGAGVDKSLFGRCGQESQS